MNKLARPFAKTWPCDGCESEPGDGSGICYCNEYRIADDMVRYARESAAGIRKMKHIGIDERRELAEDTADVIDNVLVTCGGGLDGEVFVMACGVAHVRIG